MKLIFDARVLTHKSYTGVENYTKYLLEYLSEKLEFNVVKPKSNNKYLAHLYSHLILPFIKGDILFCPANTAPFFVPKRKKLVVTIHDMAFLTYSDSFSHLFRLYYKWLAPKVVKRADKIITVSNSSKQEILKYYPYAKDKIEVIYLGLDKRYKVINNVIKEKMLLYVGSINERKNLVGIIEAFELLNRDDYKLIIVGNFFGNFVLSSKVEKILKKAKENKSIVFKQGLDDKELIYEYNISSCFVFPSFYEGFGLPPLEAMACGTPVITSNISSMPEVCGDAAIYCNPYNVNDIKEKIQIVLEDENLQKKMIVKGLARVKQFTWEKAAGEHIQVFNKVMKD